MTNIYNKEFHVKNGTLIGNWYEEQRWRDKTAEGRTIPGHHIPKKAMDFDTDISQDPSKLNNTFHRTIGERPYQEFSTTNNTYGDFSQPENKYKIIGFKEKISNDFFNCYVGKGGKIKEETKSDNGEKARHEEEIRKLKQIEQKLNTKIIKKCAEKGWWGLRKFKNYLRELSKKKNNWIHKDDVKYFFLNFGIFLEEKDKDYIDLLFENTRNEIDYVGLLNSVICCDEFRFGIIRKTVQCIHEKTTVPAEAEMCKDMLVKLLNPNLHPSVRNYSITDCELKKEYKEAMEDIESANRGTISNDGMIQLLCEISTMIDGDDVFVQTMKACGYSE